MKIFRNLIITIVFSFIVCSCSSLLSNIDDKYQPIGPVVLTANGLLMVKYAQDRLESIEGDEYKALLKEDYSIMYDRLLPYLVKVDMVESNYKVSIFDDQSLILTDWLCTEGRLDCWSYKGECKPEALEVKCDP